MMISLLSEKKKDIEDLCRRHHVTRLDVFGSAVKGTFDPRSSDIDFLVEFLPVESAQSFDDYFDLLDSLQRLLTRPVDLVVPSAVRNRYFLQSIEAEREPIYAA